MAKQILHVEDDPAIREAVSLICEKEGYEVLSYSSVESAKNELPNIQPDMAILDIMLESLDAGLTLYEDIQAIRPELPCVFLTSLGAEVQQFFTQRVKWGCVMQKPIDPESLLSVIGQHINS